MSHRDQAAAMADQDRYDFAITPCSLGALGDSVEQGLTDVAVEPAVQRRRAKEIGEALAVEPLNGRVPVHDRWAEQAAGIVDQSPTLVGGAHVVLEWRMTPSRGPGGGPLREIGAPRLHPP